MRITSLSLFLTQCSFLVQIHSSAVFSPIKSPFTMDLIQQAVQLRQAQASKDQRCFQGFPRHIQNTFFHDLARLDPLRSLPPLERLRVGEAARRAASHTYSAAKAAADGANGAACSRLLHQAAVQFEECYSIFSFLRPRSSTWRERGITDQDFDRVLLGTDNGSGDDPSHVAAIRRFVAGLLCSYSIVVKDGGDAVSARRALEEALVLRGDNSVRPAFLLAKLLTEARSSTVTDIEVAIRHLTRSVSACRMERDRGSCIDDGSCGASSERAVTDAEDLLRRLANELQALNSKDRRRFQHVAAVLSDPDQGPVGPVSRAPLAPAAPLQGTWFQQAEQCRRVIATLHASGDTAAAEAMRRDLLKAAANKLFREALLPDLDFHQPFGAKAVALAKLLEIDLTAADVVSELHALRAEYYCDEAVERMNPLQVELSLMRVGLVESPVVGVAKAPCSAALLAAQRELLKSHRRKNLPTSF
jgi:hypothetical protein